MSDTDPYGVPYGGCEPDYFAPFAVTAENWPDALAQASLTLGGYLGDLENDDDTHTRAYEVVQYVYDVLVAVRVATSDLVTNGYSPSLAAEKSA